MKFIKFILVASLLSGCAFNGAKIPENIKKIGVLIDVDKNNICHLIEGFTVFNNKAFNDIEFNNNYVSIVKDSINQVLTTRSIEAVYLESSGILEDDDFIDSTMWDRSIRIISNHENKFSNYLAGKDFDAVILISERALLDGMSICPAVAQVESSVYGLFVSVPAIGIYSGDGQYSKTLKLRLKVSGAALARQPRTLTKTYITTIEGVISEGIKKELSNYLR